VSKAPPSVLVPRMQNLPNLGVTQVSFADLHRRAIFFYKGERLIKVDNETALPMTQSDRPDHNMSFVIENNPVVWVIGGSTNLCDYSKIREVYEKELYKFSTLLESLQDKGLIEEANLTSSYLEIEYKDEFGNSFTDRHDLEDYIDFHGIWVEINSVLIKIDKAKNPDKYKEKEEKEKSLLFPFEFVPES
jgi:hypothetical protein